MKCGFGREQRGKFLTNVEHFLGNGLGGRAFQPE
jgi:hypothetical protein